jgi:hypothetical protein
LTATNQGGKTFTMRKGRVFAIGVLALASTVAMAAMPPQITTRNQDNA